MTDTVTDTPITRPGPRRLSIVAGIVLLVIGALRVIASRPNLERVRDGIFDNVDTPYLETSWHGFSATFFLFGIALIVTAWGDRAATRTVALLAAIHFGVAAFILATASTVHLGSPFGAYPVFALGLCALLSLAAALRA